MDRNRCLASFDFIACQRRSIDSTLRGSCSCHQHEREARPAREDTHRSCSGLSPTSFTSSSLLIHIHPRVLSPSMTFLSSLIVTVSIRDSLPVVSCLLPNKKQTPKILRKFGVGTHQRSFIIDLRKIFKQLQYFLS